MVIPVIKRKGTYMTFCDGTGKVYTINDRKITKTKGIVHFRDATVGERRYWDAYVSGVTISKAVYVPEPADVKLGDLVSVEGEQFIVAQKDRKDTLPVSWLLSLSASPIKYREGSQ